MLRTELYGTNMSGLPAPRNTKWVWKNAIVCFPLFSAKIIQKHIKMALTKQCLQVTLPWCDKGQSINFDKSSVKVGRLCSSRDLHELACRQHLLSMHGWLGVGNAR